MLVAFLGEYNIVTTDVLGSYSVSRYRSVQNLSNRSFLGLPVSVNRGFPRTCVSTHVGGNFRLVDKGRSFFFLLLLFSFSS